MKTNLSFTQNPRRYMWKRLSILKIYRQTLYFITNKSVLNFGCLLLSFIVLFYLLQAIADIKGSGIFLSRISKTLLFLFASFCWWIISLISFYQRYIPSFKNNLLIFIVAFNLIFIIGFTTNHFLQIVPFATSSNIAILFLAFMFVFTTLIINLFSKKRESKQINNYIPKWHFIFCLLPLIPSLHIAASNADYLYGWYYLLFFITIFILILVSYLWAIATYPYKIHKQQLLKYSSLFTFLFLSLPVVRAMLTRSDRLDIDFLFLLIISFAILYNVRFMKIKKNIISIFIIFFTLNTITFLMSLFTIQGIKQYQNIKIPETINKISFKNTPNIYLFVYDGMPNEKVFNILGISFEKIKKLLNKYNYKIYNNTYSLGFDSMTSMSLMLNITNNSQGSQGQKQDTYSGNSVVNLKLRQSGYKSYLLLNNYFTGVYAVKNKKLVKEYYPPKFLSSVQIDFFVTLFRGILQGEFGFDTKGLIVENYNEENVQKRKIEIIRMPKEKAFVVNHYQLPSHSQNSGRLLPNETELWEKKFEQALIQLEIDLLTIKTYDPESLVIIIGDHGPYLLGDGLILRNFKTKEITSDLIWDRLGTLIAIKWPDNNLAKKYDNNLTLNQDVFSVVFSYLSDSSYPLSLMPNRTVVGFKTIKRPNGIKFERGKIIN